MKMRSFLLLLIIAATNYNCDDELDDELERVTKYTDELEQERLALEVIVEKEKQEYEQEKKDYEKAKEQEKRDYEKGVEKENKDYEERIKNERLAQDQKEISIFGKPIRDLQEKDYYNLFVKKIDDIGKEADVIIAGSKAENAQAKTDDELFQKNRKIVDARMALVEREAKRRAAIVPDRKDYFIAASRNYSLHTIKESIDYIREDIAALGPNMPLTLEIKTEITAVFKDINKEQMELRPMYVNLKYSIDPRKYDVKTRQTDENQSYSLLQDLMKYKKDLAGLLRSRGENPIIYGYTELYDDLSDAYLNQEKTRQTRELQNKWEEILRTKNQRQQEYTNLLNTLGNSNNPTDIKKVSYAKEDLQDWRDNCREFIEWTGNKFKE